MSCSKSNFGGVLRESPAGRPEVLSGELSRRPPMLSGELSKMFLQLKESGEKAFHPGFVRARKGMGLKSPEFDGAWFQI